MVANIYSFVLGNQKLQGKELFEKLEELVPGLFTDLSHLEGGAVYGKLALLYIMYAYSKESKLLVLGERYANEKRRIAEYLELPDKLYGPVVQLNHPAVQRVVLEYLEYQQDRHWTHLVHDWELYDAVSSGSVKTMKREDGTIDFDNIVKVQKIKGELLQRIRDMEAEFKKEFGFVEDNKEEIKKMQEKGSKGQALNVESSHLIR